MTMPFYVAPEQVMKDRAEYAQKGIARGRALVADDLRRRRPHRRREPVADASQDQRDLRPGRVRRRRQVQRVRPAAGGRHPPRRHEGLRLLARGRRRPLARQPLRPVPRPGLHPRDEAARGRDPRRGARRRRATPTSSTTSPTTARSSTRPASRCSAATPPRSPTGSAPPTTRAGRLEEALRQCVAALAGPDRTLGPAELEVAVLTERRRAAVVPPHHERRARGGARRLRASTGQSPRRPAKATSSAHRGGRGEHRAAEEAVTDAAEDGGRPGRWQWHRIPGVERPAGRARARRSREPKALAGALSGRRPRRPTTTRMITTTTTRAAGAPWTRGAAGRCLGGVRLGRRRRGLEGRGVDEGVLDRVGEKDLARQLELVGRHEDLDGALQRIGAVAHPLQHDDDALGSRDGRRAPGHGTSP